MGRYFSQPQRRLEAQVFMPDCIDDGDLAAGFEACAAVRCAGGVRFLAINPAGRFAREGSAARASLAPAWALIG